VAKNTDDHVIDTTEVLPEEIPAELLERVAEHHANLTEVHLQVKRGTWRSLRNGRRVYGAKPPPSDSVHDICTHLVEVAKRDAELNGEGTRYRARLTCSQGGQHYTRYASVRGVIDSDGALQIIDDEQGGEANLLQAAIAAKQQSDNIAFQCQTMMVQQLQGMAAVATTINSIFEGVGNAFKQHANNQVELLRVQMEMEQNQHAHSERMAKFDRGFGIIEKPVQRIGDEIMDHIITTMREKKNKGKRKPNGSANRRAPQRSELAQDLDGIFDDLEESKVKQCEELMTADEWRLIQAARRAATDVIFDATFARFVAELKKRGNEGTTKWIRDLSEIVGQEATMRFGMLVKRIEQNNARSAQEAQPSA